MIDFARYLVEVPLPISKERIKRLGERIAASEPPAKEDLQCLNEVLRAYQAILVTVEEQLAMIGLAATSRVKTRKVIIEKLRREHGMALARVQDMAGARTVIEGGWMAQDAVVDQLMAHFSKWTGRTCKKVDRRATPSHGYRAVHVIVFPDGVPVEIQVRTELQNLWAQIVERLADRWGRGIRYGEDPEDAHLPAEGVAYPDGSSVTRLRIVRDLWRLAEQIADIEKTERDLQNVLARPSMTLEQLLVKAFGREIEDLDSDAIRFYPRLRVIFKHMLSVLWRSGALSVLSGNRRQMVTCRRRVGRLVRRTVPDVMPGDADFVRGKLLVCNTFVDDVVAELRSRLKRQQATLRDMLQRLGQYVEQGGIR